MHARTVHFDREIDLNDVARDDGFLFVRDGVGLAGRGIAARVDAAEAVAMLRSISCENEVGGPGTGPVAFGSLPFIPDSPATFVIPAVVVAKREDGTCWLTRIDDAEPELFAQRPVPSAAEFRVQPASSVEVYLRAVGAARDAVRAGMLSKAVIARTLTVTSPTPINIHALLVRLRTVFGSSYRYSFDGFVGASPELLVAVDGTTVRSHPLAGTTPRTGDLATDQRLARELLASPKNQIEHRVVIDEVHDTLLPWASYLDWEPEPSIVAVANVQHLGTKLEGRLSVPTPDVVTLARALSPTPALGGFPRQAALALINEVEDFERGRYGGAVGWVDSAGNGTWAVAIRCAQFSPDRRSATLYAGGGIVAQSDPLAELAETQAKFQAMLSTIIRP